MERLQRLSLMSQRARFARMSPSALLLGSEMSTGSARPECILMTACGASLREDNVADHSWITLNGLAPLAMLMASNWQSEKRSRTVSDADAYAMGQLTAVWSSPNDTVRAMEDARHQIERTVLADPVKTDVLRTIGTRIIEIVVKANASPSTVSREQFGVATMLPPHVIPQLPLVINKVFVTLWSQGFHMVPRRLFTGTVDQLLRSSSHLDLNPIPVPVDQTVEINPDYVVEWNALEVEYKLAVFECYGQCREAYFRGFIACSTFVATTALVKQSNLTDDWVDKRSRRLIDELPSLDIEGRIDGSIIKSYSSLYPVDHLTPDMIFNQLMYQYCLWDYLSIDCMKWVIEQSVLHNTASACAIASTITKVSALNLDLLMMQLPTSQFAKFAELVGNVLYDKFCTIVHPPITVREYPDLAFIGILIDFYNMEPNKRKNAFAGKPDSMSVLPYPTLVRIAENLMSVARSVEDKSVNAIEIAKTFLKDFTVVEGGNDDVFIIPKSTTSTSPTVGDWQNYVKSKSSQGIVNQSTSPLFRGLFSSVTSAKLALSNAISTQKSEDEIRRLREEIEKCELQQEQSRKMLWGRRYQNMSLDAQRLTEIELSEMLLENQSASSLAMRRLCSLLHQLGLQRPLPLIEENRVNPGQRRQALTESQINDIQILGGDVKPEWSQPPPAINPIAYIRTEFDNYFIVIRYRNILGAPRRGNIPPTPPFVPPMIPTRIHPTPGSSRVPSPPSSPSRSPSPPLIRVFDPRECDVQAPTIFGLGPFTLDYFQSQQFFLPQNWTTTTINSVAEWSGVAPHLDYTINAFARFLTDRNIERDEIDTLPCNHFRATFIHQFVAPTFTPSPVNGRIIRPILTDLGFTIKDDTYWSYGFLMGMPHNLLTPNEIKLRSEIVRDVLAETAASDITSPQVVVAVENVLSQSRKDFDEFMRMMKYNYDHTKFVQDGENAHIL